MTFVIINLSVLVGGYSEKIRIFDVPNITYFFSSSAITGKYANFNGFLVEIYSFGDDLFYSSVDPRISFDGVFVGTNLEDIELNLKEKFVEDQYWGNIIRHQRFTYVFTKPYGDFFVCSRVFFNDLMFIEPPKKIVNLNKDKIARGFSEEYFSNLNSFCSLRLDLPPLPSILNEKYSYSRKIIIGNSLVSLLFDEENILQGIYSDDTSWHHGIVSLKYSLQALMEVGYIVKEECEAGFLVAYGMELKVAYIFLPDYWESDQESFPIFRPNFKPDSVVYQIGSI